MEALWGERMYSSYSFSASALDAGEWSASRPGRAFTPGTHCTWGWVGPIAGLDTEARGKILNPRRESNPDRPIVQPVVRHYTAWATPAPQSTPLTDFILVFTTFFVWHDHSQVLHRCLKIYFYNALRTWMYINVLWYNANLTLVKIKHFKILKCWFVKMW
jgi:hypothetical protein